MCRVLMHNSISSVGLETTFKSEGKRVAFALPHLQGEFGFCLEETASTGLGSLLPYYSPIHVSAKAHKESCISRSL